MILGVIPARGGSSLKNKNIRPLCGKPLIWWIIQAALKSKIDELVVSTDSQEIADVALECGAPYIVKRPDELSGATSASEAAVTHTAEWLGVVPSRTVLLQCTTPTTTAEDINALIDLLDDYDSSFLAWPSDALLWHPSPRSPLPINHNPYKKRAMRQDRMMLEEAGIYAWRGLVDNRFEGRVGVHVTDRGVDINDAIDFDIAAMFLSETGCSAAAG